MGRFQNSIALAKSSWQVLRDDKQLTVLPLLSLLATLVLAVAVLLPIGLIARDGSGGYSGSKPLVWVLGFVGAVALTYIVVFFNAALVFAANSRFQGEPVTIGDAIHAAGARSHVLLPWAIVSATVSVVLRAVEQRGGIVGRIVGSIAGVAWSVVTFLVLPVLVFEGIGPIAAVKRSGELFKRTWGENLMTNAGHRPRRAARGHRSVRSRSCCSSRSAARSRSSASWLFVLWCVAVLLVSVDAHRASSRSRSTASRPAHRCPGFEPGAARRARSGPGGRGRGRGLFGA